MTGRYSGPAVALHWTIAALILFQIGYAWWVLAPLPDESEAHHTGMALHFSIGLTILLLSLARLALRLVAPPPPLPAGMRPWEKTAARASHVLFYLLIIGIPLAGWTLRSMDAAPIAWFGLFEWPHLPFLSGLGKAARHVIGKPVAALHTTLLVWATVALLALHIAGALWDQFADHPVFWRMIPFLRRPAKA
jgi:cytochrome b561